MGYGHVRRDRRQPQGIRRTPSSGESEVVHRRIRGHDLPDETRPLHDAPVDCRHDAVYHVSHRRSRCGLCVESVSGHHHSTTKWLVRLATHNPNPFFHPQLNRRELILLIPSNCNAQVKHITTTFSSPSSVLIND